MKPFSKCSPLFLCFLLVVLSASSCNKNKPENDKNPAEVETPAAPFTLTANEVRGDVEYPWTISKQGVTDSVNEDADDMYVTSYNSLTFTAAPTNANEAFAGVNVRSTNTDAVKVEVISNTSFKLIRPFGARGTEANIEVWNGSGSQRYSITFKVSSKNLIEPTHLVMLVDGQPKMVKLFNEQQESWDYKKLNDVSIYSLPKEEMTYDWDKVVPHEFIFKGFYPENSSYDAIEVRNIPGRKNYSKEWISWLDSQGLEFTFEPYEGPFSGFGNKFYLAFHPTGMSGCGNWYFNVYMSQSTTYRKYGVFEILPNGEYYDQSMIDWITGY